MIIRSILSIAAAISLSFFLPPVFAETDTLSNASYDGSSAEQAADAAAEELAQRAALRYATELFHNASDPYSGNANGKIILVEFFDFRCPHCVRMFPILQDLMNQYPELKVVYKNYPVLGPESEFAARAALASQMQGKYVLFQSVLTGSQINNETVIAEAKESGLEIPKLKKDMNSETVDTQLRNISRLADNLGLSGTPAFYIAKASVNSHSPITDVTFFSGEVSAEELKQAIDKL